MSCSFTCGRFEEVVLVTLHHIFLFTTLDTIKSYIELRLGNKISIGTLHSTLNRLEEKGYIWIIENDTVTQEKVFRITYKGVCLLREIKKFTELLWLDIEVF